MEFICLKSHPPSTGLRQNPRPIVSLHPVPLCVAQQPKDLTPMTFHGLYQRYETESAAASPTAGATEWPPIYRGRLPHVDPVTFELEVSVENQSARSLSMAQIKALPTFSEVRLIASKFGWAYRGHWHGLTFQTLFSLFSTPHLYRWVKLESTTGEQMVIEREHLSAWRIVYACNDKPLSPLYGGPLWIHCFDHYVEYSFPHLHSMMFLQSNDHKATFPGDPLGYKLDDPMGRIQAGEYFSVHEHRVVSLGHLGRKV